MTKSVLWGALLTRVVTIGRVSSTEIVSISLLKRACSLRRRAGERHQVRNACFRAEAAAHPFDQNFDAVPGGDEPSDQFLQALQWALGNLDILSLLQSLVDLHKFVVAHAGF